MSTKLVRIGIVVDEPSGDILGAGLVMALRKLYPNAVFEGICGPKMQDAGCNSLFDMEELTVMGLLEVLPRIIRILRIRKALINHFINDPPDIFIGIDAPAFNLGLETKLRENNIPVAHYVSPTIWAWKEKRIFKIQKAVDLMLCLFPFETDVYDKHSVNAKFVGHTLADQIPVEADRKAARQFLNVDQARPVLAMLPGSRAGEVSKLFEVYAKTAEKVTEKVKDLLVLVPVVNKERKEQIEQLMHELNPSADIRLVIGHSRECMTASNIVLMASGTATLEGMLCKRPMVVGYKLNWLTHQIMKWRYKAKYFALPNILADELLIPELLQEDVNPQLLSEHLLRLLNDDNEHLIHKFEALHLSLKKGADVQAAKAVSELIEMGM